MSAPNPVPPPASDVLLAANYGALSARRNHFDTLLWQAPVIALTAQAFLFLIALTASSTPLARIVAMLLSLLFTVASIVILIKHRYHELLDADLLRKFEDAHRLYPIHAHPDVRARLVEAFSTVPPDPAALADEGAAARRRPGYLGIRGFRVWLGAFGLTGAMAVAVIVITVVRPGWLA